MKVMSNSFKWIDTFSAANVKVIDDAISESSGCYSRGCVWTGFTDEKKEGDFIDINEDKRLETIFDNLPFSPGEPNGDEEENCLISCKDTPFWHDAVCQKGASPFCKFDRNALIQIRGKSLYDRLNLSHIFCMILSETNSFLRC